MSRAASAPSSAVDRCRGSPEICPDAASITPNATTFAAIITHSWSTMPTAVITESIENTTSTSMICVTMASNVARLTFAVFE